MDGLFYLMSVVGVGIVMWWAIQNDRVPPDKPTIGMFAMFTGAELARRRGLRGLFAKADSKPLRGGQRPDRPASPQDLMR
jgi:hypothetical protein